MTKDNIIGAVLAGGQGRRVGGDKALIEVNGRPLVSYAVEALESVGVEVVLALRSGQEPIHGHEQLAVVYDRVENTGPLAGYQALLEWMPGEWALVLSCDQPFVRVELLRGLIEYRDCDADVVVARTDVVLQPMPGLYRSSCLPAINRALERSVLGIQEVLAELHVHEVSGEALDRLDRERSSFININTPEDLANARRLAAAL